MNCNRRQAFFEELKHDWNNINLAAKALIFIGILVFIASLFIAFNQNVSKDIYSSIEVVFRTSLASIFGFLLSSNLKNDNSDKDFLKNSSITLGIDDCEEDREEYNFKEGNSVQLIIAFIICIVCIIAILTIYVLNLAQNIAAISQLRDLMCSSLGFILGESKIKK